MKNRTLADKFFKENPEADKCFICDGFEFKTKNAAELHKNRSGKKDLKVLEFSREETPEKSKASKTAEKSEKPLDKMNKPELQQVAKNLDIRFEESDTKTALIEAITKVKESKINE